MGYNAGLQLCQCMDRTVEGIAKEVCSICIHSYHHVRINIIIVQPKVRSRSVWILEMLPTIKVAHIQGTLIQSNCNFMYKDRSNVVQYALLGQQDPHGS